jgi:hypothetical protein
VEILFGMVHRRNPRALRKPVPVKLVPNTFYKE